MKILEKLKSKQILVALAGLVGLGALFIAPTSEAGIWIRVIPSYYGPGPYYHYRHFVVHRWCHVNRWGHRQCYVRRRVWVN